MNARCLACKLLYTMKDYYEMIVGCPHCQPMWYQIVVDSQQENTDAVDRTIVSQKA